MAEVQEIIEKPMDLFISYKVHVELTLRHAIPLDFKIVKESEEIFRNGVMFFKKDANFNFYGPFFTGEQYGPYDIKELLESENIFVIR
jgi:hypothetical protein